MKKTGRIFIILSTAVLILWIIPWISALITAKPFTSPLTLYSPVLHDFTTNDRGKALRLTDRQGKHYGDEVQPLFYYMVLVSKGKLPKEIDGHKITPEKIKLHRYNMAERPQYVNVKKPAAYLLMESVPERLELHDPEYAMIFRKDGLHIYEMASNSEDKEKTKAFTSVLSELEFKFPANLISGNPTHHKEHDEGYLLTDSEGKLFRLKMTNGKPEAEHFAKADGIELKYISVIEIASKDIIGYLTDKNNVLYILRPSGEAIRTEAKWNPQKESLFVVGDMLYHTIKAYDSNGERIYALRTSDFSFVDKLERNYDKPQPFNICRYLLPFRIYFVSSNDAYVMPRIKDFSWAGLMADTVIASLAIFLLRRKKNTAKHI